ncbi:MAG: TetR/AcrR family transcriptional regulator [Myxococcota bacterium]
MLLRLGAAAVECFERHGPGVTISTIADHAGVSRRTVSRYVSTKEELLYVHQRLWLTIWEGALDRSLPLATRMLVSSRAVATSIDADPDPPRRTMRVARRYPSLLQGFHSVFQYWIDRVAAEVLVDHPDHPLESRVVGSAVMGAVDASLRAWLDSEEPFSPLFERSYALIRPVLDQLPAPSVENGHLNRSR